MTNARSSFGSLLKIGDGGGSESFATISEVLDISGPGFSLNTADATSHDSTGGWNELIGTILQGGQVTFTLNWQPGHATHSYAAGLLGDMVARTLRNFQLVIPTASPTTWSFSALVTGFPPSLPVDGKQTVAVTLSLSGQPTLA